MMREPMTEQRLREAQEVAWSPAYRPTPGFPEHVYRHDLFRDAVAEIERLRGTAGEWRSTLAVLHHILAEHRIAMPIEPGRPGPPKLIADLMQWVAMAVEREAHWQRERAEAEADRLRSQLGEPEVQWGHQVHADDGHRGDEVPQADEQAAWHAVAHLHRNALPADARAVVIQRDVRIHEGPWRVVPECECPHTDQPDGRLVRDGVLAAGCPVHDPDADPS